MATAITQLGSRRAGSGLAEGQQAAAPSSGLDSSGGAVADECANSWLAPRLTCGSMLEVSRDAAAAGEEQLVSCAAEQSKYWCCRRRFHICLSFARLSLAWLFALGRVLT